MAKAKKATPTKKTGKLRRNGHAKTAAKTPPNNAASGIDKRATVDRRAPSDRREGEERRKRNEPVTVERRKLERRVKVNRRRQIDPTTCERDYSTDEVEFMNALDDYKRASGRMFPTCSEVLEVIRTLGYEKRTPSPLPDGSRQTEKTPASETTPA